MSKFQQPAFPTVDANREEDYGTRGMTLRDYFAAKSLPSVIDGYMRGIDQGHYSCDPEWRIGVALDAYQMADAMMKVREAEELKP